MKRVLLSTVFASAILFPAVAMAQRDSTIKPPSPPTELGDTIYSTTWDRVQGKPPTATRWPTWNEVSNKPDSFTPGLHNHDSRYLRLIGGSLTGTLNAKGINAEQLKTKQLLGSLRFHGRMDMLNPSTGQGSDLFINRDHYKAYIRMASNNDRRLEGSRINFQRAGGSRDKPRYPKLSKADRDEGLRLNLGDIRASGWSERLDGFVSAAAVVFTSPESWQGGKVNGQIELRTQEIADSDIQDIQDEESAPITRMTITPSGNVGVGTIRPSERFHVVGNILASSYNTPSDIRLKKIEAILDGQEALDALQGLDTIRYTPKDEEGDLSLGVIAQQVSGVFPEVVYAEEETGHLSVSYGSLVVPLIAAVNELNRKYEDLREAVEKANLDIGNF